MAPEVSTSLRLPLSVVGPVDVGRLIRELELLDNFFLQAAIREPEGCLQMPKTSRLMDETVQLNKTNVLLEPDRKLLLEFLRDTTSSAPTLHISFSADPSPAFLSKILTWLRAEIHPLILLRVGLQPNIGAGCVVRSSSRYFDMTLRQRFIQNRHLLMKGLHEINQ